MVQREYDNRSRRSGPKPRDPVSRVEQVRTAVQELEKIGACFTMADVAERAGISRATIYRNADLRAEVGAKGDGARMVASDVHAKLVRKHAALRAKAHDIRRQLRDAEQSWEVMRERALTAEQSVQSAERRLEALLAHHSNLQNLNGANSLEAVAKRLEPDSVRRARRVLARALHPDLFSHDPAAAALATELLKSLNALAK